MEQSAGFFSILENEMEYIGYYNPEMKSWEIIEYTKEKQMQFLIQQSKRGWYIRALKDGKYAAWFVWKDLELHIGRGWNSNCRTTGDGMGYYYNVETAEYYLRQFKEKHNMNDKIEINVKVNGKDIALHEVSEQTLLTIRENSKPKPVPAFRVCRADGVHPRLIIKMPKDIGKYAGKFIMFDSKGFIINSGDARCHDHYSNMRELKLEDL